MSRQFFIKRISVWLVSLAPIAWNLLRENLQTTNEMIVSRQSTDKRNLSVSDTEARKTHPSRTREYFSRSRSKSDPKFRWHGRKALN